MLTGQDKALLDEQGYLVVADVIPHELCDRVIDAITDSINVDLDDESTWYQREASGHGLIPLHHHQALWDVRQHPALHEVFAGLYGTEALWVSNDRVSYKPPAGSKTRSWRRDAVHWDCDPWQFTGFSLQGLVYLTDTTTDQGAFMCVPGIFRDLPAYLEAHAADDDRRHPRVDDADLVRVAGGKGSLVVFSRLMPHTSDVNHSSQHRFVQYVTMSRADESERARVVREWRERLLPDWAIRQAISEGKTREAGEPAQLTDLGRKLVGLDDW